MIDFNSLAHMNFGRSDPLLMLFGEDDAVAAASYPSTDKSTHSPIEPEPEYLDAARLGQISVGWALVDGERRWTAYVPVALGSGSRSVFAVSLTKSPVAGLRDELITNHIMVIAALSLLVLGVGYVVTRTITKRIMRLRDGAVEIGNGNLSFRIEESANDEMGTLAREFNLMSDRLKEQNSQLEEANRTWSIAFPSLPRSCSRPTFNLWRRRFNWSARRNSERLASCPPVWPTTCVICWAPSGTEYIS